MDYKLGLITGIIRNELAEDFWGTMEKVAALGYKAIEGGSFLNGTEAEAREGLQRMADLGMELCTVGANHSALEETIDETIEKALLAGARHVTSWWGPAESEDQVKADAERYNKVGEKVRAAGLKFCYHNHDHEFKPLAKRTPAIQILLDETDADKVFFEVDVAWVTMGGQDPVHFLLANEGRVPVIHLKDVASTALPVAFTSVGTGVVDVRGSVLAAVATGAKYVVVEQDRPNRISGLESVTAAALNLRDMGLA